MTSEEEHAHRWKRGRCRDCGEWCFHPASQLREEPDVDRAVRYRCGVCGIIDQEASGYTAPPKTARNWATGGGGVGAGSFAPSRSKTADGYSGLQRRRRVRRSARGASIRAVNEANAAGNILAARSWWMTRAEVLALVDERPDRLTWPQYRVACLTYLAGFEDASTSRLLKITPSAVRDARLAVRRKAFDYEAFRGSTRAQLLRTLHKTPQDRAEDPEDVAYRRRLADRWRVREPIRGRVQGPPRPWSVELALRDLPQDVHARLRWQVKAFRSLFPGGSPVEAAAFAHVEQSHTDSLLGEEPEPGLDRDHAFLVEEDVEDDEERSRWAQEAGRDDPAHDADEDAVEAEEAFP